MKFIFSLIALAIGASSAAKAESTQPFWGQFHVYECESALRCDKHVYEKKINIKMSLHDSEEGGDGVTGEAGSHTFKFEFEGNKVKAIVSARRAFGGGDSVDSILFIEKSGSANISRSFGEVEVRRFQDLLRTRYAPLRTKDGRYEVEFMFGQGAR